MVKSVCILKDMASKRHLGLFLESDYLDYPPTLLQLCTNYREITSSIRHIVSGPP